MYRMKEREKGREREGREEERKNYTRGKGKFAWELRCESWIMSKVRTEG